MLKLVEVANYLTNQLNTIGSSHTPTYSFNIQAEVGANKNAKDVQGIIKTTKTELPPTTAGKNVVYNLLVELSIVAPTTNFNLKNVEEIVNSFVNSANGQEIQFESGKGLITLSLCQAGQFKTEVGQGNVVPLSFNVRLNYTEGMATSKSKHWFLQTSTDGQGNPVYTEIPYLLESVLITKEGRTNKINGKKYSETFMLGQQKRYRFTFLYDETSALCQMLQKDILDSKANKQYKLKYYDGITYTSANPYITTVSIFETGSAKAQAPNTADFDITFADVDDGNSFAKYYMALIDNPFDEATENTRCFSDTVTNGVVTREAWQNQRDWYNDLVLAGCYWQEIPAPNISSLFLTNQIYTNDFTIPYGLEEVMNKNYAIIKIERGGYIIDYLYYWTKNPTVLTEHQVSFDLKLDSLQTFLFKRNIKFEGNMIERASLNRWVDNGDGTVSFDGTVNSQLFERENIKDIAKRLVTRQKMEISTGVDDITEFCRKNVIAWAYINLHRTGTGSGADEGKYPIYNSSGNSAYQTMENTKAMSVGSDMYYQSYIEYNGHNTLVVPILKTNCAMYVEDAEQNIICTVDETIKNINKLFGGSDTSASPYIYNVKLSCKPPFNPHATPQYRIITRQDGGQELYLTGTLLTSGLIIVDDQLPTTPYLNAFARFWSTYVSGLGDRRASIYYINDWMEGIPVTSPTAIRYKFNKTELIGQIGTTPLKNKIFNPKLNNLDYKSCSINMYGTSYEFDLQKLNRQNPLFLYSEAMTMDTSKYKIIPYTNEINEIYSGTNFELSYNGLVGTNDTSIEISTDQLDTYLANNKNFYLSFQKQQERQMTSVKWNALNGIVNGATSGASSGAGGVVSALAGAGMGAVGGAVSGLFNYLKTQKDQEYQRTLRDLSIDDMRSAPDVVSNANGNAIFNTTSGDIAPYMEIYEALPHELEMANDDMYMNGFTYNKIDDIFKFINKTGSKHIRRYFNYVQALIGNISGISIGSQAREDLRQRLANGVRFWHTDTIDYEHENAEKWLNIVSQYTTFTTTAQYVGYMVYIANVGYDVVTVDNKDNIGIVPGTTIAYYKYIN